MTADEATLAWLESRMDEVERVADRLSSEMGELYRLINELRQATRRSLER